jgi:hypothetical protein
MSRTLGQQSSPYFVLGFLADETIAGDHQTIFAGRETGEREPPVAIRSNDHGLAGTAGEFDPRIP